VSEIYLFIAGHAYCRRSRLLQTERQTDKLTDYLFTQKENKKKKKKKKKNNNNNNNNKKKISPSVGAHPLWCLDLARIEPY